MPSRVAIAIVINHSDRKRAINLSKGNASKAISATDRYTLPSSKTMQGMSYFNNIATMLCPKWIDIKRALECSLDISNQGCAVCESRDENLNVFPANDCAHI